MVLTLTLVIHLCLPFLFCLFICGCVILGTQHETHDTHLGGLLRSWVQPVRRLALRNTTILLAGHDVDPAVARRVEGPAPQAEEAGSAGKAPRIWVGHEPRDGRQGRSDRGGLLGRLL